jgi:hypothetical protein
VILHNPRNNNNNNNAAADAATSSSSGGGSGGGGSGSGMKAASRQFRQLQHEEPNLDSYNTKNPI